MGAARIVPRLSDEKLGWDLGVRLPQFHSCNACKPVSLHHLCETYQLLLLEIKSTYLAIYYQCRCRQLQNHENPEA